MVVEGESNSTCMTLSLSLALFDAFNMQNSLRLAVHQSPIVECALDCLGGYAGTLIVTALKSPNSVKASELQHKGVWSLQHLSLTALLVEVFLPGHWTHPL